MQAVKKVGGPFGTAVLGSVLSSVYLARLDVTGLTAPAAAAARQSVFAGLAAAHEAHSAALASPSARPSPRGLTRPWSWRPASRSPVRCWRCAISPAAPAVVARHDAHGEGHVVHTALTPSTLGLRERKKAKTRALIQAHALRLFEAQGYEATTVEADRRGRRGLAEHLLPLLPDEGRRGALGRVRPADRAGVHGPAARARLDPGPASRVPDGVRRAHTRAACRPAAPARPDPVGGRAARGHARPVRPGDPAARLRGGRAHRAAGR